MLPVRFRIWERRHIGKTHVEPPGQFGRDFSFARSFGSPVRFAKQHERALAKRRARETIADPFQIDAAARIEERYAKRSGNWSGGTIDNDRGKRRFQREQFRLT